LESTQITSGEQLINIPKLEPNNPFVINYRFPIYITLSERHTLILLSYQDLKILYPKLTKVIKKELGFFLVEEAKPVLAQELLLQKEVLLGREYPNDFQINLLSFISRIHFKIMLKENGNILIEDLGSKYGTGIREEKVKSVLEKIFSFF
ncbi:MAG: FHA domain-containing protein, partial [Candidatus Margulisbacteria bacterium]|nr:FHA domain-containing protein [Candidatus Margulisiibacteriota bacterium]